MFILSFKKKAWKQEIINKYYRTQPAWRLAHWRMNTGSVLKIDSSNFFSGDVFNYVTNLMTSPAYLR
jgi:hypothetical protein